MISFSHLLGYNLVKQYANHPPAECPIGMNFAVIKTLSSS